MSNQGIFYSIFRGQGKTIALVSFFRPGVKPKRMIIDMERRAEPYISKDGEDHPEQLLFAVESFHEVYAEHFDNGDFTGAALVQLYDDIRSGEFPYNVLLIDDAAMFQDEIRMLLLGGQAQAKKLASAFRGVAQKHALFLNHRYKTSDNVSIYTLLKSILDELLLACRKRDIDVMVATEKKNVWDKYGTKDMRILGQTAKILEPFMKYADFSYEMSRTVGDRQKGKAKLVAVPWVNIDTFNPKNSLPGLKPRFEFTWEEFWRQVESRGVTTQEQLDEVKVKAAEIPEGADDGSTSSGNSNSRPQEKVR
jgi:hypothetical protein